MAYFLTISEYKNEGENCVILVDFYYVWNIT